MHRWALARAGARSVRLVAGVTPPSEALEGLVIGGGDDIGAEIYGAGAARRAHRSGKDTLELRLLEAALPKGLPVLGICRGSQMINVALGGTLHTDIHEVYELAPKMRTVLPKKTVSIVIGSRLDRILNCNPCRVNALHHQSVDRLGRGLAVVAKDESGIVQAIEGEGESFLVGGGTRASRLETSATAALRGACQGGAGIAPRFRRTRPPCRKRSAPRHPDENDRGRFIRCGSAPPWITRTSAYELRRGNSGTTRFSSSPGVR